MRFFLFKFIIFLIFFLISDYFVGQFLMKWLPSQATDWRIERVLSGDINADLLIFGSSRAAHNVMAKEISRITNISSYNLGVPGADIDFTTQILELVIARGQNPKYAILTIDAAGLTKDTSINFRYDILYPFAGDESIRQILVDREHLDDFISRWLYSYRLRHGVIEIFKPYRIFSQKTDPLNDIQLDGSMPLSLRSPSYKKMTYKDKVTIYDSTKELPALKTRYIRFIDLCNNNGIKLILVICPNFARSLTGLAERIHEISGNNVVLLDYSQNAEFLKKEYYYDVAHLYTEGAFLLSEMIGNDLGKIISNSGRESSHHD